jgi:subfamily B ATP-binding cassette protein MsbA
LKNINLIIPKGATVALVGRSGAGKSTMVNLISRFYDVTDGHILINGIDIREYNVHSLRRNIGYVSQDPFLFNESVTSNIAYHNPAASMEDIINACKVAYAHDFISKLPEGYDTLIGERGGLLSGGQKQRLTIARALLKDPPILILDEATNSLDTEAEREVQKALTNLMKGRTSIIIAHRLSTIRSADVIVLLEKGSILAKGKHADLIEKSGIYRKLCENS